MGNVVAMPMNFMFRRLDIRGQILMNSLGVSVRSLAFDSLSRRPILPMPDLMSPTQQAGFP
jgi:hypothetical protein